MSSVGIDPSGMTMDLLSTLVALLVASTLETYRERGGQDFTMIVYFDLDDTAVVSTEQQSLLNCDWGYSPWRSDNNEFR